MRQQCPAQNPELVVEPVLSQHEIDALLDAIDQGEINLWESENTELPLAA